MIANLLPKKTYHRKVLYCFILSFISISVTCGQPLRDTLFINTANGEYPLYKHLYIYKTDRAINADFAYGLLKQGAFKRLFPQKTYSDALNVAHYYWLFFKVKNTLSADETFYCQLNSNMLNVVKAYLKTGSNGFTYLGQEGCDIPFKQRAYRYSDVVFPLMIKHGKTQTIVLQISGLNGEDLHCLPQLRSSNVFKAEEEKFYTTAGLITGVMLTVVILNIFLGISLKVKLHFVYAANVLFALYEIISIRGLDIQFLYPDNPKISVNFEYISICIWSILIINVMQLFLNQKKENSRVKLFVDIIKFTYLLLIPINVIILVYFNGTTAPMGIFSNIFLILIFFTNTLLIVSAIEKIRQKYKAAWLYLAANMILILGTTIYALVQIDENYEEVIFKSFPNPLEIGLLAETIVVFFGIVYRYNLYKQEKEKLMIELNAQQQSLIENIIAAEEAERKRIAADLHNDVGATLSALSMYISNAKEYLESKPEFEQYYRHGLTLSNKAVNDIRDIAHNLLPKDFTERGIFTILEERVNQLNANTPIRFALITEGDEKKLNDVLAITVYRIINELLNNICKHSMAAEAAIQILIEGTGVQIMAEDDGIGFNSQIKAGGIGLRTIKDRVEFLKGHISVDNNNGTQIIIRIPL